MSTLSFLARFSFLRVQEMIANPFRFEGDSKKAREFFEDGIVKAFTQMREAQDSRFPLTCFMRLSNPRQRRRRFSEQSSTVSTGWETMLEALFNAEFRNHWNLADATESANRNRRTGTNALASSIVLACRPAACRRSITTRKDFLALLKKELPRHCAISRKAISLL